MTQSGTATQQHPAAWPDPARPYGQQDLVPPLAWQLSTPPPPPAPRRPGWGALVLAGLGSAVLASGLTAGGVMALDDPGTAGTVAAAAPSAADRAPLAVGADAVDWTVVARTVSPSVVSIQVAGQDGQGQGSGVVLDERGHILTNDHVVAGGGSGAQVQVVLADGRVFSDIEVVGLDPATDLAVLQITDTPDDLVPVALGDSGSVVVGQGVMAVGNPLGLSDSVTTGIVSATDRPVTTGGQQDAAGSDPVVTNAIQTDAAVNPGNSGGALVDASGSLIGIPSSIASMGSQGQAGSIGLGFAIPVNEAKRIADELIATGQASHAWLGVQLDDGSATADGATRQGAQVVDVTAGTPAQDAGLQPGDVIVSVDGDQIAGSLSLTAQVRERAPGEAATLSVVRDGGMLDVAVQLGTRPES